MSIPLRISRGSADDEDDIHPAKAATDQQGDVTARRGRLARDGKGRDERINFAEGRDAGDDAAFQHFENHDEIGDARCGDEVPVGPFKSGHRRDIVAEDAADARDGGHPDGRLKELIECLCKLSAKFDIDWEIEHDHSGGPVGYIRGGNADAEVRDTMDGLDAMFEEMDEDLDLPDDF